MGFGIEFEDPKLAELKLSTPSMGFDEVKDNPKFRAFVFQLPQWDSRDPGRGRPDPDKDFQLPQWDSGSPPREVPRYPHPLSTPSMGFPSGSGPGPPSPRPFQLPQWDSRSRRPISPFYNTFNSLNGIPIRKVVGLYGAREAFQLPQWDSRPRSRGGR